jgi:hypothetical protein
VQNPLSTDFWDADCDIERRSSSSRWGRGGTPPLPLTEILRLWEHSISRLLRALDLRVLPSCRGHLPLPDEVLVMLRRLHSVEIQGPRGADLQNIAICCRYTKIMVSALFYLLMILMPESPDFTCKHGKLSWTGRTQRCVLQRYFLASYGCLECPPPAPLL